jgi:hypothetical protein
MFNHSFNQQACAERLLNEYRKYDRLIVGIDFDNTIKPIDPNNSCDEVVALLQRCSQDPKIALCLWSICQDEKEVTSKINYCTQVGINIDYVITSPLQMGIGPKQFFNVLLDDRAGLESAYYNLKYVLDNVESQSN